MKNYLLIITDTPETAEMWTKLSSEQMQAGLAAYMAFTKKLSDEGRLLAGEGLGPNGKVLRHGPDGLSVTDGPLILGKEMVGGFYFYKAANLEEATELAKDCPALRFGSTVEVREQMDY